MSKFMKTIRIIFSLLTIILTAFTFIAIEGDSEFGFDVKNAAAVFRRFSSREYGFYIIAIAASIVIVGGIILLISTLIKRTSVSTLTLVDDGGKVVLTDDAIEAYAKRSLWNFNELRDIELRCKILNGKSKKVFAKVKAGVKDATDLSELSIRVKDRLKTDIDTFIGKDIAEVSIVLDEIKTQGAVSGIDNEVDSMEIQ